MKIPCKTFSVLLLLAALTFSCGTKSLQDEIQSIKTELARQDSLIRELQAKASITKISSSGGIVSLVFDDGKTLSFDSSSTPVLTVGKDGYWTINTVQTTIPATGSAPEIKIGQNGNWFIAGQDTGVKAPGASGSSLMNVILTTGSVVFYFADGSTVTVPFEYRTYLPKYYEGHIAQKEDAVVRQLSAAGKDNASFIFFTDSHWGKNQKHSPAIVQHLMQNTGINKVFFGGDVITSNSRDKEAMMKLGRDFQKAFAFAGDRFYGIYGNHDDNSTGQWSATEYHLTEPQVYSFLQSQMTGDNVCYEDYYNFHVDFRSEKTRYICLDTGRYYYGMFRDRMPVTARFLADALAGTPEGWNIIILSHLWAENTRVDGVLAPHIPAWILDLLAIADAYNARTGGSYKYKDSEPVPYDFADAAARVVFCLGGHNHTDALLYSRKGIPVVLTTCDAGSLTSNSNVGTINEQSVTAVVVDYADSTVYFNRVGRGADRTLSFKKN